jgi:hypothetical protein
MICSTVVAQDNPKVVIVRPNDGAFVFDSISIVVKTTNAVRVEYYCDDVPQISAQSGTFKTVIDTKALAGGTHTISAIAYNAEGAASVASRVQIFVDNTPPSEPSNVTALALDSQTIRVAWDAAEDFESGISGYWVCRDGEPVAFVDAPLTQFDDTGLTENMSFCYTVSAVNRATR